MSQEFIGLIWDRHRTRIGQILKVWARRWGKAGEQLSILDETKEFLEDKEPDRSKEVGVTKSVAVDGADTSVEKFRKERKANNQLFGAKNMTEGGRCLTWSSQTLSFEHTAMVCSRMSEKGLYREWGSLGRATAPLVD